MTHVVLIGNTVHHWCGNLGKDNSKERESLHRKELETSYQSSILIKFPTIHGENFFEISSEEMVMRDLVILFPKTVLFWYQVHASNAVNHLLTCLI